VGAVRAAASYYHGRFGTQVMDPKLSLVDDPRMRTGVVTRSITCEGFAARRTRLINSGELVGLLANFYDAHRLAADPERAQKLGPQAHPDLRFLPTSGYRLNEGGVRDFQASVGTSATNVVMTAEKGLDEDAMLRKVKEGIYVGRVWYTYPINGQRAGDFTCTVTGDSYVIRNGKRVRPLAPNCLRINAKADDVFAALLAAGRKSYPAMVWGSPEAFYVPELAIEQLDFGPVAADD
jgi:PmbA protein